MMIMPANHSGAIMHHWATKYAGAARSVGWLVGPTAAPKTKLRPWAPFALDNDAFSAWSKNRPWNEAAWFAMLGAVSMTGLHPLWAIVPDVVADREATLAKWERYAPAISRYGWPLAFAVQDGMTSADVPAEADVIFVGGSTDWKWRTVDMWAATGKRVHVGRVNELDKLFTCEALGVESVDGTGWFQGTAEGRQARALASFLDGTATPHPEFNF